jgi:hypothetical protein
MSPRKEEKDAKGTKSTTTNEKEKERLPPKIGQSNKNGGAPATASETKENTADEGMNILTQAMIKLSENIGTLHAGLTNTTAAITSNFEKMDSLAETIQENQKYYDFSYFDEQDYEPTVDNLSVLEEDSQSSTAQANDNINEQLEPGEVSEPPSKKAKFLQIMKSQAEVKKQKGERIEPDLANNITLFMRQRPDEGAMKEVYQSLPPPENCGGLEEVYVNEKVWKRVRHKTEDIKLQRPQNALLKGTTAFARILDVLLNSWDPETQKIPEEKFEDIMDLSTKAMKCFGAANYELVMRRRENIRPKIGSEFGHLCVPGVPYTNWLFGDDVTQRIKDIADDNRVYKKVFPENNVLEKRKPLRANFPRREFNKDNYRRPVRRYYDEDRNKRSEPVTQVQASNSSFRKSSGGQGVKRPRN